MSDVLAPSRHCAALAHAGLVALLAAAPVRALEAQAGVVHGTVRDTAGQPVPSAVVVIGADRRARADSLGRFTVTGVKPGFREVRVRRIGHGPYDATLRLRADGTDTVRAELGPAPPRTLPAMVTRDERECPRYDYAGLLCRKAEGRGTIYTIDEIDELQPEFLADLMDDIDGINVVYAMNPQFGAARYPRSPGRCMLQLRNGRPQWAYWTPWARRSMEHVVGLEVHEPGNAPPEYEWMTRAGTPCWIVVVWTWDRLQA